MERKSKMKFSNLNKNIKFQISTYLPFPQRVLIFTHLDKKCLKDLNQQKYIKFLKEQFKDIVLEITFKNDMINNIISEIKLSDGTIQDFSDEFFSEIIKFFLIRKYKHISDLDIRKLKIGENSQTMYFFSNTFCLLKNLLVLNLSANSLGYDINNIKFLTDVVEKNKFLYKLNLANNDLGLQEINIRYIAEIITKNNSVQKLDLSGNKLGEIRNSIIMLSKAFKSNTSLQSIFLNDNNLGVFWENLKKLSHAFKINKNIQSVSLKGNNFNLIDIKVIRNLKNDKKYLHIDY